MAISDAAAANPAEERRLVELAGTRPLKGLREECDRVKAAADPDADATHERVHRERSLRIWSGAGVAKMFARCTPEQMAVIRAAVDARVDELFEAARASGKHEPRDAYAMDALHQICAEQLGQPAAAPDATPTTTKQKAPTYLGLVRVDLEALRRGQVEGDELCEIVGLGPVPVRVAGELLGDAVLHLILTNGTAVGTTVNVRRGPNVAQRMALLWTSPGCAITVCNRTRVEIDHDVPWTACRTTELRNLRPLCGHCHALKTNHGYRVIERDGVIEMRPPDAATLRARASDP